MASDLSFVEFVAGQMDGLGEITTRKMFGEYALYYNGKIIGLVCDNQLFIKPTQAGKNFIQHPVEAPPYPGAKLYFLITDQLEDREWLTHLVKISAEELPLPKLKSKRKTNSRS